MLVTTVNVKECDNRPCEAHVFDSMTDVADRIESNRFKRPVVKRFQAAGGDGLNGRYWVGRDGLGTPESAMRMVVGRWDEGIEAVEEMVKEICFDVPVPQSIRRRVRFSEFDGDEVCFDRLRAGQDFWRSTPRVRATSPKVVTICADTALDMEHDSIDGLWRGAAAIVATKMLEEAGYRVELWFYGYTEGDYDFENTDAFLAYRVKRSGEPLDIGGLANVASGWFRRSVSFALRKISNRHLADCCYPRALRDELKSLMVPDCKAFVIEGCYCKSSAIDAARRALSEITGDTV